MRPKILALASHPGGMNAIVPVIKRLNLESLVDVSILAHSKTKQILQSNGLSYSEIGSDVDSALFKKIVDLEKPQLLLMGQARQDKSNPIILEHLAAVVGRNEKIPTISLSDFWTNRVSCYSDIYEDKKFEYLTEKITVIDDKQYEILIKEGFPSSRLVITGNPYFDNLEQIASDFEVTEKLKLRSSFNKKLLIYYAGSSWISDKDKLGYSDIDNLELLNESIKELDAGILISLHPRLPEEDRQKLNELVNNSKNIKVITDKSSQKIILSVDLIATTYSTVGIEALYLHKPVISIQPNLKSENYFSFLKNIVPIALTEDECRRLVEKVCNSEYRQELIDKAKDFRTDGKATERVVNLVYESLIN